MEYSSCFLSAAVIVTEFQLAQEDLENRHSVGPLGKKAQYLTPQVTILSRYLRNHQARSHS